MRNGPDRLHPHTPSPPGEWPRKSVPPPPTAAAHRFSSRLATATLLIPSFSFGHTESTRSLCRSPAAGGGRSAPAPPHTGHRPRNPVKFDTRHSSFGVLSRHPMADFQRRVFYRTVVDKPLLGKITPSCPLPGGCLIAKATRCGGRSDRQNRRFDHQPVFSCVPAAASFPTRIDARYQPDHRSGKRHGIGKAVFVQLVLICPQALANVFRSGQ